MIFDRDPMIFWDYTRWGFDPECNDCDRGGHTCQGCGDDIPHGWHGCKSCLGMLNEPLVADGHRSDCNCPGCGAVREEFLRMKRRTECDGNHKWYVKTTYYDKCAQCGMERYEPDRRCRHRWVPLDDKVMQCEYCALYAKLKFKEPVDPNICTGSSDKKHDYVWIGDKQICRARKKHKPVPKVSALAWRGDQAPPPPPPAGPPPPPPIVSK